MKVDIWSDVVCPWCYIGKRRFEQALQRFGHGGEVEVTWHSFELDSSAPRTREGGLTEHLAAKYGVSVEKAEAMHANLTGLAAAEGLEFRFDRAQPGNTFDAHRLVHLGRAHGMQDAVKERFLRGYLTEGEPIGQADALRRLAVDAGLEAAEVDAVLGSDRYAEEVRADEAEATALGIRGVPFFVLDRTFGVSGAQPAEVLLGALEQAWTHAHPLAMVVGAPPGGDASACEDGSCAV